MLVVVLAGVALRLAQWFGNPSLWFDELQLVRNLSERGLGELVSRGLQYGQVAPVGFLVSTELVTELFGGGELALRAVPLVASIAALILFWRLVDRLLAPVGAFVATAAFALNPLLVSLGSVTKQYATDVFATVAILCVLHVLLHTRTPRWSRALLALAAGTLGLLSIPSVMVAAVAILAVLHQGWVTRGDSEDERVGAWWALPLIWGGAAAAAALWARGLLTPDMQEFMTTFWTSRDAFAPPVTEYPTWVLDVSRQALIPGLFLRPYFGQPTPIEGVVTPILLPMVILGGMFAASAALLRERGVRWTAVVVLPLLIALALSRLEVYPLHARTSVFLLPLALILIGATADLVADLLPTPRGATRLGVALLSLLSLSAILAEQRPPYQVQSTRQILSELARRRAPEDPAFAHPWAASALAYYGPQFGLVEGVVIGREEIDAALSELSALEGESSVWVLFTLAEDRDLYLCYLDEVGREVERVVLPGGMPANGAVSIHRYDLSDHERWEAARRADFPVTDAAFAGNPPRCRRGTWL